MSEQQLGRIAALMEQQLQVSADIRAWLERAALALEGINEELAHRGEIEDAKVERAELRGERLP